MKKYDKPKLRVGQLVTMLGEDYHTICILDADYKELFSGELGDLRHIADRPDLDAVNERFVDSVNFDDYDNFIVILEKALVPPFAFQDFPKKELQVVDLIHYMDGKEIVTLIDEKNNETLYDGRVEYLQYTGEGNLDERCTRMVSWFEAINRPDSPRVRIYLEDETKEEEE